VDVKYWLTLVQVPESEQLVDIALFAEEISFSVMVDGRFRVGAG